MGCKKLIKKFMLFGGLIMINFLTTAQTNTFPSSGNVLISAGNLVQTGNYSLQTQGAVKLKDYLLFDSNGDFTGGDYYTIQDHTSGYLRMGFGFLDQLVLNSNGNVGIGTAVPSEPLHVKDVSGSFTFGRPNSEMNNRFTLDASSGYENQIYFRLGKGRMFTSGNNLILGTTPSAEHIVILANSGNVGIGTSTTGTHKLAVEGTIGAREIKVETTAWPDYVFEPNYELLSLTQTKEYIEANKHLPEVPSATEMEQNGVALGEMNVLLLKKIEELTLHQIALMETVELLKKEIGDLKNSRK